MRGGRPKPTALKLIEGNPGKRPLNTAESKPAASLPTCPAHLSPTAKAEWKRLAQELHRLGILSQLDRAVLAAYCQAYGRWTEAERKLKETPVLLKTPSGYVQPSPWLAIANKAQEQMLKLAAELGLSPARVSTLPSLRPKPWEFGAANTGKFAGLLGGVQANEDDAVERAYLQWEKLGRARKTQQTRRAVSVEHVQVHEGRRAIVDVPPLGAGAGVSFPAPLGALGP